MKTRLLTGVQATGMPHLGNYVGAIRPAFQLAESGEYESFLFIADYHALTTVQNQKQLRENIYEVAATWLALGLNPDETLIYKQSDIPQVMELNHILACFTPKGLMNRAHAYKALIQKAEEAGKSDLDAFVNMGTYTYPILMSADIMAFDAHKVPVGEDNLQHLEICRDVAGKINHQYGDVLIPPEPLVQKTGKLLPGLDGRKMSKSYSNSIPLFVPEKKLRKLVMKVKTDSTPPEAPKDPDNSLVFDLYKEFATAEEVAEHRKVYQSGISWGEAKQALFEKINQEILPARNKYDELMADKTQIDRILAEGAARAYAVAEGVLARVKKAIGVI